MQEDFLLLNLTKYPKLAELIDSDISDRSRFLARIKETMRYKRLSYNQVVAACHVMEEKKADVRKKR